jgi:hypothetical protein
VLSVDSGRNCFIELTPDPHQRGHRLRHEEVADQADEAEGRQDSI